MSILFNVAAIERLLDHIESAHNQLARVHPQLTADATAARFLLAATGAHGPTLESWSSNLDYVTEALATEHRHLSIRLNRLVTADAQTAYMLATTTGRTINTAIASQAITSGWTYDETIDHHELAALNALPRPLTNAEATRHQHLTAKLAQLEAPFTSTQQLGDGDADINTPRIGTPLHVTSHSPTERGREYLIRSIADTANPDQIQADEFEAYLHHNGNVTIVLPGVVDLSNPDWGYNEQHQSLRDLDQQALGSAAIPGLSHNAYAQRVAEWAELMVQRGVITPGATTALVGHSFGSDTAFDLALDPQFNGKLLTVTHVFGAGYELTERIEDVPEATFAVTANNIFDSVALAESYARYGKVLSTGRVRLEAIETVVDTATGLANNRIEQLETELQHDGLTNLDLTTIPSLEIAGDIYAPIEPNGLQVGFEGGFDLSGAGHHQREYQAFLEEADNPLFTEFLEDLDHSGFTASAVAVSVDVSRPSNNHARNVGEPQSGR